MKRPSIPILAIFLVLSVSVSFADRGIAVRPVAPTGETVKGNQWLYGIGARLDEDPSLFFTLRGVDTGELISRTVSSKAESLLKKASKKSSRIIEDSDLSAVFGIDLAGAVGSSQPANDSAKEILAADRVRKAGPRKTVKGGAKKKAGSAQAVKPPQKSVAKRDVVKRKAAVKAVKKKQIRGGKKKQ